MIVRIWRGVTEASKAEAYLAYIMETGVSDYRAVPGNQGVQILHRTFEDRTEFLILSYWESFEAIRAFAGEDQERAVYYAKDHEYLLEMDLRVTHYEVATEQ